MEDEGLRLLYEINSKLNKKEIFEKRFLLSLVIILIIILIIVI